MTDSLRLGLLAAYRKLMQPLVRVLIRNGVSFGELAEVLKNVFVEVAARDFQMEDRKISRSRIAIVTGLTRKEVARQEDILRSGKHWKWYSNLNRVTRVLEGWHSDPDFHWTLRHASRIAIRIADIHELRESSAQDIAAIWRRERC